MLMLLKDTGGNVWRESRFPPVSKGLTRVLSSLDVYPIYWAGHIRRKKFDQRNWFRLHR